MESLDIPPDGDRSPQHRNICFTVFAEPGEDLLMLDPWSWPHMKYCIYSREVAPDTGREHFQGYVEFTQPKSFSAIHAKCVGLEIAHFERRRGSAKQAIHYCLKPEPGCYCNICSKERTNPTHIEGPFEYGEKTAQGQRQDLLTIKRELDQGKSLKRVAQDDELFPTFIKFPRALETYKRWITTPRDFKPIVMLFVGPSGIGKTRTALLISKYLGSTYIVPSKHTGFWCDDYMGEDTFFIDEMNGDKMTPEFFNGLVDRYPFVVPSHGNAGHQLVSRYIIICSNYAPRFWWKKRSPDQLKQTTRRIDLVFKFMRPFTIPNLCPHCVAAPSTCPFHKPGVSSSRLLSLPPKEKEDL